MSEDKISDEVGVSLYKYLDQKVEGLRADVAEAIKQDLALGLKVDQLTDRVNNGVAVTGQKTLEKVTDLVGLVGGYRVEMSEQKRIIEDHQKMLDRMTNMIFILAGTGVLGGMAAMAWKAFF